MRSSGSADRLRRVGELDAARERLGEARTILHRSFPEDPIVRVPVLRVLAEVERDAGDREALARVVREGLELASSLPPANPDRRTLEALRPGR